MRSIETTPALCKREPLSGKPAYCEAECKILSFFPDREAELPLGIVAIDSYFCSTAHRAN